MKYSWVFETSGYSGQDQWVKRRHFGMNDAFDEGCFSRRKCGQRLTAAGFGRIGSGHLMDYEGVYAIVCFSVINLRSRQLPISEHILYIGSSQNIRKRLAGNHHVMQRVHRLYDYGVRCIKTPDYRNEERRLIKLLRPAFNIHHNGA